METTSTNEGPGTVWERMFLTFIAPGDTFASVREQSTWRDWFVPTLVGSAAFLVPYLIAPRLFFDMLPMFPGIGFYKFLWLFIAAGVLLLLARSILGGGATYGRMLAVIAYASLVKLLQLVVNWLLGVGNIGLGLLLPLLPEWLPGSFAALLVQVNLFNLWQVLLTAIGTGVMTGSPTRRALVPVLILWAMWLVALAGLGAFPGAMPPF